MFFVAPADFNSRSTMADTITWIEQQFDAPTYNHVVFCSNKSLLTGDYLIDTKPCPNFMGTVIQLETDEFKTWEDIAIYFERLGGQ